MGFLDALSAIGGLAGGVAQGEQIKQRRELEKAQTSEIQSKISESMASNIRTQLIAHPELATNPNYVRMVTHASKQYKFDLPMTPAGGIDVDVFAPNDPLTYIKANYGLNPGQIKEQSTAVQLDLKKKFPQLAGLIGDGTQEVPTLPQDVEQDKSKILAEVNKLKSGESDLGTFDAAVKFIAGNDSVITKQTEELLNTDPDVLKSLSKRSQAYITKLEKAGIHLDEQTKIALTNSRSLAEYRAAMEKHMVKMDSVAERRLQQTIDEDAIKNKQADARIEVSRSHLKLAMDNAAKGGAAPGSVKALDGDAAAIDRYRRALDASLNSYQKQANELTRQGNEVPEELADHINQLQKQRDDATTLLGNYANKRVEIQDAAKRSSGINVKQKPSTSTNSVMTFPNESRVLEIMRNVPREQRLQILQTSGAYGNMSPEQQAAATKAVEGLP
jgi:hypothetical protein